MHKYIRKEAVLDTHKLYRPIRLFSAVAVGCGVLLAAAGAASRECGDDTGPNESRVPCACGDTVVTATKLRETDPVLTTACPGDGLIIGADDIRLSCRTRAIVGAGKEGTTGIILSGRRGVTVKDCKVQHFGNGISIQGGGENTVKDTTVKDIDDFAIAVGVLGSAASGSDANRMARNSVRRARVGIRIAEGTATKVEENVVMDCVDGIQILGPDSLITDNSVKRSSRGIVLFEGSNRSLVEDNSVKDNGSGIFAVGTRDSVIDHNIVKRNDIGIHLFDETGRVEVSDNHARENGVGILLESNVNLVSLIGNHVKESADSGIVIGRGPAGLTFEANETEDNGGFGIEDATAGQGTAETANVYVGNDCDDNALGLSSPPGLCE